LGAIEVENSLLTAELMARAALMRRESRGSHYREDYPDQDDEQWRKNIVFRREAGELRQTTITLEAGA
jgi:succinate dehydrogenase/fumarate reductase flavoprotein subunit